MEVSARTQVAGPSGSSGIWDAAAEVAEVEKLAEMGVVLSRRKSESSSTSRKGKGKETVGHIVFAEVGENVTTGELAILLGRHKTNSVLMRRSPPD